MALILFVLLAGGGIGAVGFVEAGDGGFPGERIELESWRLPVPQVGDAWSYTLIEPETGAARPSLTDGSAMHRWMAWEEPSVAIDSEGLLHRVNRLVTFDSANGQEMWVDSYDAVSQQRIAVESRRAAEREDLEVVNVSPGRTTSDDSYMFPMKGLGSPCLLLNEAQGRDFVPDEGLRLSDCHVWYETDSMATHMRFDGAYLLDGHTYVVLVRDAADAPFWHVDRAVFRTDLPVPVQVTFAAEEDQVYRMHWALTRFLAGDGGPLATDAVE